MRSILRHLSLCCLLATATAPALAQQSPDDRGHKERGDHASPQADKPHPPQPDAVTHQSIDLPGRNLDFTATAGFVRILDDDGMPEADIGTTAYTLDGADPAARPVTFVINGGPGNASAWLQMGAVGPWRIPFVSSPSATAVPQPNADTWLDFTDLVFVDPAGTGYSRILSANGEVRKRLWSVNGDIDALSQAMRRWLDKAGRTTAPKVLLGESYGGFRGPRLAQRLADHDGVGLRGLVLVSPVLDFGNHSNALDLLGYALRLPSMAAAVRFEAGQPFAQPDLADVEAYATGPFLTDVLRGTADPAAVDRVVERVSTFTGLDTALVRRHRGLVSGFVFEHEHDRATNRLDSAYDTTVSMADPFPELPGRAAADPVTTALTAPVTESVLAVYDKLHWHPEGQTYRLFEPRAVHEWDFGRGRGSPESIDALRQVLSLDPQLHVLIGHGLFDLVTPFEGTRILLNQIPRDAGGDRVRLVTLPGGHMFYSRDASRAAFRAEAAKLIGAP